MKKQNKKEKKDGKKETSANCIRFFSFDAHFKDATFRLQIKEQKNNQLHSSGIKTAIKRKKKKEVTQQTMRKNKNKNERRRRSN